MVSDAEFETLRGSNQGLRGPTSASATIRSIDLTQSRRWRRSTSLQRGGARARARRRHRRAGGLHPPDPVRRRARDHPPAAARPDAGADDAGHRLRPADRRGLRAQAGLLLGRQPRRRLAAPVPRRGRARLAARRSSSRSTATPGWPTATWPAPRGLPFAVLRGYNGTDLPEHTDTIAPIDVPVHRRGADRRAGARPGRRRSSTPSGPTARATSSCGGIAGVQKEAVLGAERSLVTVEEIVDELEPRPGAVVLPRWAVDRGGRGAARRAAVLRAGLLRPRQRLLPGLGRDQPRPRHVHGPGWRSTSCGATSADEMMTVAAARELRDGDGRASSASGCRARPPTSPARTHAPGPGAGLRVGHDRRQAARGCRCRSATASWPRPPTPWSSVPEIFNYWLQPGRIDVGFLGAAQIDRYANINTTVIGDYDEPKVRLPGAGGAPEIAALVRRGDRDRAPVAARVRRAGRLRDLGRPRPRPGRPRAARPARQGPTTVITDLGVLEPDPETSELVLTHCTRA